MKNFKKLLLGLAMALMLGGMSTANASCPDPLNPFCTVPDPFPPVDLCALFPTLPGC